ncbi:MAG TPA: hypothetical protein PK341_17535 [Spirochaetota bacterium]|nr:hypothetical protein [Spirochaetota bacterium]
MKKIFTVITLYILLLSNLLDAGESVRRDLIISQSKEEKIITLSWPSIPSTQYMISRSERPDGLFKTLIKTRNNYYIDRDVEQGIKYWYNIKSSTPDSISFNISGSGFIEPEPIKGLMPDEILNKRTKDLPLPKDEKERLAWEKHLSVMKGYYENYLTVAIIIFIGKIYIKRGQLIVFRNFLDYAIDYNGKTIHVFRKGMTPIKFHSKRLFRFLKRCEKNDINETDILPRLVKNAIFYCVRRENAEKRELDGRIRIVPVYEALGMSTEYFRDYKKWRSNTVVFGSDTKDLDDLIEKNRPQ